jgi:hypothetical protein
MQKVVTAFILFSIVFCSACHKKIALNSDKNKNTAVASNENSNKIKKLIVDLNVDINNVGSEYVIDSVKINNDILSLFVNYSGGCKTHIFELYSNAEYAKSLPLQTWVCLKHINNDDACRQLISEELKFNISQLQYKGQNTVIINIGNKQKIAYSYK